MKSTEPKSNESKRIKTKRSTKKRRRSLFWRSKNDDHLNSTANQRRSSNSLDDSHNKSSSKLHNIRIQASTKPEFPKVILNQKIMMQIERPSVKVSNSKHLRSKSLNQAFPNALNDLQYKSLGELRRSSDDEPNSAKENEQQTDIDQTANDPTISIDQVIDAHQFVENGQSVTVNDQSIEMPGQIVTFACDHQQSADSIEAHSSKPNCTNSAGQQMNTGPTDRQMNTGPTGRRTSTNSTGRQMNTGKEEQVPLIRQESLRTCRVCKSNVPKQLLSACACENEEQWIHPQCLADQMERTGDYEKCGKCKTKYNTDQMTVSKSRRSCYEYFTSNRDNFASLMQLPFYLGFIFLLLALGLIQYEQSYKIVYLRWSVILVFLIIVVIVNHLLFFISLLRKTIGKVRRFKETNFKVTIRPKYSESDG